MIEFLRDEHRRHLALTALVAIGLALYLTGVLKSVLGFDLALLLTLIGGFPIYFQAITGLFTLNISADLAVGLAAMAALFIGQYAVAAEVILIMLIGEAVENFAVGRTRSGIAALLALRPEEARVRRGDEELAVPIEETRPDDVVLVRPGDRIPIDGQVLAGSSSVDQSPITGESLPVDKLAGDDVYAGTINMNGALELSLTKLGESTTLERIIQLVEEAEEAKAPTEGLADKYAKFFVPIVIFAALVTYLISRDLIRSVAVLVVACPCALVLATPTAIAAGIGSLVRKGVLVKGGAALEHLGRLRTVLFDKTGTLTCAKLRISQVVAARGCTKQQVLQLAASAERYSEHPIGQLIVAEAQKEGVEIPDSTDFVAHPGRGALATVDGAAVRVGNQRFLEEAEAEPTAKIRAAMEELSQKGCTVVLVARDSKAIGAIAVEDTIRPEAAPTVASLAALGIGRVAILTGDNEAAASAVAEAVSIEDVRSRLLPDDKVAVVREAQGEAAPVAMVGDGINDAPSLVAADVGVAMADIGTDVAIGSADVVLVGDDLSKLVDAVACGRRVLRTIWQNILGFALGFNALAVLVASLGWISPVVAAVLHQVSSLIVVLNSLRLLADIRKWRDRGVLAWLHLCGALYQRWRVVVARTGGAVALIWLLSGFYMVRIGEEAVVQRFGKVTGKPRQPGLHCRLPYPFGSHRNVRTGEVRRVEIGFRTMPGSVSDAPAYEWNVQHRGGKHVRQDKEADVWAGDENLVDVTMVVHYRVSDPAAALFGIGETMPDGANKWDTLVRDIAEAALRAELTRRPIEAVFGSKRAEIESNVLGRATDMLRRCQNPFTIEAVCLADVHPPLEVVPAFRDVASALEEKEAQINEAQAYQRKTVALTGGQVAERMATAEAFKEDRKLRAQGGADRFVPIAEAQASAPELARLRLYLETIEVSLSQRRKVILDKAAKGTRRMVFLGDKGLWRAGPVQTIEPVEPTDSFRSDDQFETQEIEE